jgi:hypothetical protein
LKARGVESTQQKNRERVSKKNLKNEKIAKQNKNETK